MSGGKENPLIKFLGEVAEGIVQGLEKVETEQAARKTTGWGSGATDPVGRTAKKTAQPTEGATALKTISVDGELYVGLDQVLAACEKAGAMPMLQASLRRIKAARGRRGF